MYSSEFPEISEQKFLKTIEECNEFKLEDIILLSFGYDPSGCDLENLLKARKNSFPIRQYTLALEATNAPSINVQLPFAHKTPRKYGYCECIVRKSAYFKWAHKQWSDDPTFMTHYNLWKKYKAKKDPKANFNTIKNIARERSLTINAQLHAEAKNKGLVYKINISEIARQLQKQPKFSSYKPATLRRYLSREHIEANKQK